MAAVVRAWPLPRPSPGSRGWVSRSAGMVAPVNGGRAG